MYTCVECGKDFEEKEDNRYTKWCSGACCQRTYFKNNPEKVRSYRQKVWRENKDADWVECCICGFEDTIDWCHIVPKSEGGKVNKENITPLCPNHHRLYDKGELTEQQESEITTVKKLMEKAQSE